MTLLKKLDLPEVDGKFRCKRVVIDRRGYMAGADNVHFFGEDVLFGDIYLDKKVGKKIQREIQIPSILIITREMFGRDSMEFLKKISGRIEGKYQSKMEYKNLEKCFNPIYNHYKETFKP